MFQRTAECPSRVGCFAPTPFGASQETGDCPLSPGFTSEELAKLIGACERDLGPADQWFAPDGYPGGFALCMIDSVFSINAGYEGVVNVVRSYRGYRAGQRGDADTDGVLELMGTFEHFGRPGGLGRRSQQSLAHLNQERDP